MLILTKWGTVKETDKYIDEEEFKERSIDKFINELEKNLGKEQYELYYNEDNSNFRVKFNGVNYNFDIGDELKENYKNGLYNGMTIRLKKLVDKQQDLFSEYLDKTRKSKQEAMIIRNAKNGILEDYEAQKLKQENSSFIKKDKTLSKLDFV